MKGYTIYDEAKNFDMDTDSAEELLEKLPPEEKKRLAKQLLKQERQRQIERARATKPSAREVFEMRQQATRPFDLERDSTDDLVERQRKLLEEWTES